MTIKTGGTRRKLRSSGPNSSSPSHQLCGTFANTSKGCWPQRKLRTRWEHRRRRRDRSPWERAPAGTDFSRQRLPPRVDQEPQVATTLGEPDTIYPGGMCFERHSEEVLMAIKKTVAPSSGVGSARWTMTIQQSSARDLQPVSLHRDIQ